MEKIKRNERIAAIVKILVENPNIVFTLAYFSEAFNAAKSTISEDIAIARETLNRHGMGVLETIAGAGGGIKYIATPEKSESRDFIQQVCDMLSRPSNLLPGGFLYTQNILNNPTYVRRMGEILAREFYSQNPDFVVTMETKGITVAMMVARALGRQLVVISRGNKVTEGPAVTINYFTRSSNLVREMSLSRRAVKEGQKALIIDDYLKGGGTAKGVMNMMKEFAVTVVGTGVVIATAEPKEKLVTGYRSLMLMEGLDEEAHTIRIKPAAWLTQD